jgi:hypothetical protein
MSTSECVILAWQGKPLWLTLTAGMSAVVHLTCTMLILGRIAVAPPFTGLRRFPQGRGFKQWTGDDSKALMKVQVKFPFSPA